MLPPERIKHSLSKSTFMRGHQCPLSLWLHFNKPRFKDTPSPHLQQLLQQGTDIGLLARQLFPNGVDISPQQPYQTAKALEDTFAFISMGYETLYEAAFQYNGIYIALDILVKINHKWVAFEVKSSQKIKEEHLYDAALQYHVLQHCGIDVSDFALIHINPDYTFQNQLDTSQLFSIKSVLPTLKALQPNIAQTAQSLLNQQHQPHPPEVAVGAHCLLPYTCDFFSHCWQTHLDEDSILNLLGQNPATIGSLLSQNINKLTEVSDSIEFTPSQLRQIYAHKLQQTCIDNQAVSQFISALQPNIAYLEVAEGMVAIPQYNGHKPYHYSPIMALLLTHSSENPMHFKASSFGQAQQEFYQFLAQNIPSNTTLLYYDPHSPQWASAQAANTSNGPYQLVNLAYLFNENYIYSPSLKGQTDLLSIYQTFTPHPTPLPPQYRPKSIATKQLPQCLQPKPNEAAQHLITQVSETLLYNLTCLQEIYNYLRSITHQPTN